MRCAIWLASMAAPTSRSRSLVTNTLFANDGSLVIFPGEMPTVFTATVGLSNFDSSTRTLTGGIFQINGASLPGNPAELRFNGADIVNLASSLQLYEATARITDLAGTDALRNLAHILPAGVLTLGDQQRVIPGDFQNDGVLSLAGDSVLTIAGTLTNFDANNHILSGGSFTLAANSQFRFSDPGFGRSDFGIARGGRTAHRE